MQPDPAAIATLGIWAAWNRYWHPDLEELPDVFAEYVLTVGVADVLDHQFEGKVAIEFPTSRISPSISPAAFLMKSPMLRRMSEGLLSIGVPLPTTFRHGRIDVVVFRDEKKTVPMLLVELKRSHTQRKSIQADAERLSDILEAYSGQHHADLEACCMFPVILKGMAAADDQSRKKELNRRTQWLHTYASSLVAGRKHRITARVFINEDAVHIRLPFDEEEDGEGNTVKTASNKGFAMIPVALRLKLA